MLLLLVLGRGSLLLSSFVYDKTNVAGAWQLYIVRCDVNVNDDQTKTWNESVVW